MKEVIPKQKTKAPLKKTNEKIVKQALFQVSLPGALNEKERNKVNAAIEKKEAPESNHIILFKGVLGGKAYRALYEHSAEGTVTKVSGAANAPMILKPKMVDQYYKFNVGSKEFTSMHSKSFQTITDAVSLKKEYQNAQ